MMLAMTSLSLCMSGLTLSSMLWTSLSKVTEDSFLHLASAVSPLKAFESRSFAGIARVAELDIRSRLRARPGGIESLEVN